MTGCPFCSACALGPGPESLIVAQRPQAFVMLNRYPYVGGHLMVIPRVHVSRVTDLASETWDELSFLVRESIGRLEQTLHPGGVNMGMNQGEAAGAGIASHLHIHLVPRWAGDTNFMAVTAGTRVVSQGLEHAYSVLRPVFADLDDRY